jgi:hypothetical protein
MLKAAAISGAVALFVTASSFAYAQTGATRLERLERLTAADLANLTDARVNIVKSTLQLTPDQEKYWPAVEDAIRNRSKDRQARITNIEKEASELQDKSPIEILRDRNPVEFMRRRSEALAQRSADLKKLADAWEPLYQTLNPDQRKRMAQLALVTLRELRNIREHHRLQSEEEEE